MIVFAHRGLHYDYLENSFEAICSALDCGCQALEVDLQLTIDNKIILMHDLSLKRIYNVDKLVSELTLSEINLLPNRWSKVGRIICLDELLSIIPSGVLLNLELKSKNWIFNNDILIDGVYKSVKEVPHLNILISSFNPYLLMQYRKIDSQQNIAIIFGTNLYLFRHIIKFTKIKPVAIHFAIQIINPNLLREMHNANLRIHVYTVNELSSYSKLSKMGVDGVFSDNPLTLRDYK